MEAGWKRGGGTGDKKNKLEVCVKLDAENKNQPIDVTKSTNVATGQSPMRTYETELQFKAKAQFVSPNLRHSPHPISSPREPQGEVKQVCLGVGGDSSYLRV